MSETDADFIDIAVVVRPEVTCALDAVPEAGAAVAALRSAQVANILGLSALQIDIHGGYGGELFGTFGVHVRDVQRPAGERIWIAHDFRWKYGTEPVAQLMRRALADISLHEVEEALFIDGRRAFQPHHRAPDEPGAV